ncbi:MAG: type ISP restriction/modification enzyme [Flavobacteriales bacterium]
MGAWYRPVLTLLDVLDYCYAVLHSPAYRAKYKEFLKSDFPRIPYPTDAQKFRALVKLGARPAATAPAGGSGGGAVHHQVPSPLWTTP